MFKIKDSIIVRKIMVNNKEFYNENISAEKYSRLVTRYVRRYFLVGGDFDDLYQEGMIALLGAIRKYDSSRSDNFEAFASKCIKNRLVDVIRRDILESDRICQGYSVLSDCFIDLISDPETKVIGDESATELKQGIWSLLSAFEASVLDLYLKGYTVKEISVRLEKNIKSVDNAVVRIRNKLKQYLNKRRQQE